MHPCQMPAVAAHQLAIEANAEDDEDAVVGDVAAAAEAKVTETPLRRTERVPVAKHPRVTRLATIPTRKVHQGLRATAPITTMTAVIIVSLTWDGAKAVQTVTKRVGLIGVRVVAAQGIERLEP